MSSLFQCVMSVDSIQDLCWCKLPLSKEAEAIELSASLDTAEQHDLRNAFVERVHVSVWKLGLNANCLWNSRDRKGRSTNLNALLGRDAFPKTKIGSHLFIHSGCTDSIFCHPRVVLEPAILPRVASFWFISVFSLLHTQEGPPTLHLLTLCPLVKRQQFLSSRSLPFVPLYWQNTVLWYSSLDISPYLLTHLSR